MVPALRGVVEVQENRMSLRGFATALGAAAISIHAASFAAPAGSASENDAGGLEEVVVTAQRREESAQNVGIAISVLSGRSLADKSITNVVDLQNAIPSLQVEPAFGGGQPQYRIRGVGFLDFFFLMIPPPPRSTLFPYTTLFR